MTCPSYLHAFTPAWNRRHDDGKRPTLNGNNTTAFLRQRWRRLTHMRDPKTRSSRYFGQLVWKWVPVGSDVPSTRTDRARKIISSSVFQLEYSITTINKYMLISMPIVIIIIGANFASYDFAWLELLKSIFFIYFVSFQCYYKLEWSRCRFVLDYPVVNPVSVEYSYLPRYLREYSSGKKSIRSSLANIPSLQCAWPGSWGKILGLNKAKTPAGMANGGGTFWPLKML